MTTDPRARDAARRWRHLFQVRARETERLGREAGFTCMLDIGAPQARRLAMQVLGTAEDDPLLAAIRGTVGLDDVVLDIGVGPGRLALPLANRVRQLVAVDQSRAMLNVLRREAGQLDISNVRLVHGRWEEVDIDAADVAVCSYVFPYVENADRFLAKVNGKARRSVFVGMGAISPDAFLDPLWRYFHDQPRHPLPTYLDAVAVLLELGIEPSVSIVEVPSLMRFATLAQAVSHYRTMLLLPKSRDVDRELRRLLDPLLEWRGGSLWPPGRSGPAAILCWKPDHVGTN